MAQGTTDGDLKSSVTWEGLEPWLREQMRETIQRILEEEVTDLLGRAKSERKTGIDSHPGYRNGYGKSRNLTLSSGTVEVRRPRIRGLSERFESRVLPAFARRTREVGELLPELYLHGLSTGDFDLALRGLLGEDAPLSAATVQRLKSRWQGEYDEWSDRKLDELEVVYLWVDGVYVKAGLEKDKAALFVVVAGLSDGRKVVLAVTPGYRESTESWATLLRQLRARGLKEPKLVVGDGNLGIWGGLSNVYPGADQQRCWNHRLLNVMDRLPKKQQPEAKPLVQAIAYSETRDKADEEKKKFQAWCTARGFARAGSLLDEDWERMVAYYRYPKEHWKHLRTTNIIESAFSAVRLRTDAAKRFKRVANATAVIWKTLMVGERRFRRLDAPELLKDVYLGAVYDNGVCVRRAQPVKRSGRKRARA
jgi:transposase-like protein